MMKKTLFTLCCLLLPTLAINAQPTTSACNSAMQCNSLARSAFDKQDYETAVAYFQEAEKQTAPSDNEMKALLHNSIGWTHYAMNQYSEARKSLLVALQQAEAIQSHELIIKITNNLGLVELADGKLDEAETYFASKYTKDTKIALTGLQSIKAQRDMQEANDFILKGLSFQLENKFEDAIKQYDKALAITPNNTRALTHKAAALYGQKEFGEAAKILKPLYDLSPQSIGITIDLLKVYCASSNTLEEAITIASEQKELLNKNAEIIRADSELCKVCPQGIIASCAAR